MIRIAFTSVMVDDQEKARKFYTDTLGFVTKHDIPMGGARWLTVVAPGQPNGVELLLEPIGYDFAKAYQKALFDANIPLTAFAVDDTKAEYDRLTKLGVTFRGVPSAGPGPSMATFEDSCGNLIQIFQA